MDKSQYKYSINVPFIFRRLDWTETDITYHVGIIPKHVIKVLKIETNGSTIQVDSCKDQDVGFTMADVGQALVDNASNGGKNVRVKIKTSGRVIFMSKDVVSFIFSIMLLFLCICQHISNGLSAYIWKPRVESHVSSSYEIFSHEMSSLGFRKHTHLL